MTGAEALEAVIRHATDPACDYDDIASTVDAPAASGDSSLLPRLHEASNGSSTSTTSSAATWSPGCWPGRRPTTIRRYG